MNRKVSMMMYGPALLTVVATGVIFILADRPADRVSEQRADMDFPPAPEEQERQLNTIQNHTAAENRLDRALIAGRLTLEQGAERLHDLHTVNPYFNWQVFRDAYRGATDEERCCCQLLGLVRSALPKDPVLSARVQARLQREFDDYLKCPIRFKGEGR